MPQPSSRPAEIKALSGARAFPPLILVLYHFCEGHGYRGNFVFDALVAKGYLWVEFFFILSGFILTHVYGRASGFRYFSFLRARLARLYPLHIFMLFVMLGLVILLRFLAARGGYVSIYDQPYHPINTWQGFVASVFLVQAWNILSYLTWNGASWFVSVEFLLCLLFPAYLFLSRGGVLRGTLLIVAGLAALTYLARTSGHGLDLTFHNGIFRGAACFAVGVGLSMLYRAAAARGWGDLPEGLFSLAQLAAVLLLLDAIYRTQWAHKPADIYVAAAMAALIFTLAFDRGIAARALSTAPVLKLGEWSYAIYIGQTAWLQFLRYLEQRWYPHADPAAIWWIEPIALVAVCVVWGALLATVIERPANRWLRQRAA
ncbi:MAG TPA: acyltransferase [Rhizomicrobium sp.]|nr:acyltransferase [Rhizomicrobium sp.]